LALALSEHADHADAQNAIAPAHTALEAAKD
jgi:hypothetical protein